LRSARHIAAAVFCTAAVASAGAAATAAPIAAGAPQDPLASPDGRYPEWIDHSVPPGTDFFRFANGGWLKANPIPPDRASWGVDTILERTNQAFIRTLIESIAAGESPEGSAQRKVADFYASGMDEKGIEAAGIAPLQAEFARIAALSSPHELPQEIAHLLSIGIAAPLQIGQMQDFKDSSRVIAVADQAGLGLPNRDYYLRSEPNFVQARTAYKAHVMRMFVLLGDDQKSAERESGTILAMETRLAEASMSDIEQRNPASIYHPMTLAQAQSLAPLLQWPALFAALGHAEVASLNVGMPLFMQAVDRELAHTALADWKTYLRWQLIDSFAPYLAKAFVDENFRMAEVLTGAHELQPRWLRVLRAEDEALGFAVGELYVARKFTPADKAAAMAMVLRIRDALRSDLATLAWMTPATRTAALAKLDLMELRIGYPDRWRDYSGLAIDRGPYVANVMRASAFEQQRELDKIGKPVDRSEWYMTPQTVNAYYDPSMNSLNVPAGILQPPYFDDRWSAAVSYGATGATIGHEMTHGFDDEGAQFDGHGNLKDWWAPEDLRKFQAATQCIVEQFSAFKVNGGLHVQGELVSGEAAADLGGLILALRAWQQDDAAHPQAADGAREFTPAQEFFVAYAHSWAGAVRPEELQELVTTDPHPPAEYRVTATLANVPEFQTAFALPGTSPMVRKNRCVIW
jgi:putative endopeptidase